jgi:hypothetical protein
MTAIAVVVGWLWWFDADRLLARDKPQLEALRARYCQVLAREETNAPLDPATPAPTAAIVKLGYYSLVYDNISRDNPGGNMDAVDVTELTWMCKGRPDAREYGKVETSILADLLDRGAGSKRNEYAGVKHALHALPALEYLLVLRLQKFEVSVAAGAGTMLPGRYAGKVTLYRLADATPLSSIAIDQDAPGFAMVYTRRNAFGESSASDVASALSAETSIAFEDAIVREFSRKGVDIKIR